MMEILKKMLGLVLCFMGVHDYPKRPPQLPPGVLFTDCLYCRRCKHWRSPYVD